MFSFFLVLTFAFSNQWIRAAEIAAEIHEDSLITTFRSIRKSSPLARDENGLYKITDSFIKELDKHHTKLTPKRYITSTNLKLVFLAQIIISILDNTEQIIQTILEEKGNIEEDIDESIANILSSYVISEYCEISSLSNNLLKKLSKYHKKALEEIHTWKILAHIFNELITQQY